MCFSHSCLYENLLEDKKVGSYQFAVCITTTIKLNVNLPTASWQLSAANFLLLLSRFLQSLFLVFFVIPHFAAFLADFFFCFAGRVY